jgi:hypothetical protein
MKFTLIKETSNQRMYKSDVEITKFPNDRFDWDKEIELARPRLKQGVSMLEDKCFYVVVSDARTHIERLVFAGMRYEMPDGEEVIGPVSMLQITGYHTMMIYGGDTESVRPDEVYLRQISILNSKKDDK